MGFLVNFVARKKGEAQTVMTSMQIHKTGGKAGEASLHYLLSCEVKAIYSVWGLSALAPICSLGKYSDQVSWHAALSQQAVQAAYLPNLQNGN